MDLEKKAFNIRKGENGIFYSKSDREISYPEEGNEHCMQIEADSFWFNHRNNVIAESVKKYSADKVFFDIGGGNGFVSRRIQDDGTDVVLVEPGKQGATNGFKRGIKNVLCSTLEDAEFAPGQIDSVGLFDVVEHIENDELFLSDIHKYLKDDGLVYITVPAYNFLWSNEDDDAGHYKRYTTGKLNELLKSTGYKIVYSTYIFSILPLPVFIFRSIPSKLGFNKSSGDLKKHQNEHKAKKGLLDNLMQRLWNWEIGKIKKNKKIPFGGSCFVVAKKIAN